MAPVAYAFKKIGKISLRPRDGASYEQIWDEVVEAGADDLSGEMRSGDTTELEVRE